MQCPRKRSVKVRVDCDPPLGVCRFCWRGGGLDYTHPRIRARDTEMTFGFSSASLFSSTSACSGFYSVMNVCAASTCIHMIYAFIFDRFCSVSRHMYSTTRANDGAYSHPPLPRPFHPFHPEMFQGLHDNFPPWFSGAGRDPCSVSPCVRGEGCRLSCLDFADCGLTTRS